MYYTVVHRTTYDYENPVLHGHHLAHLKPRATPNQYVAQYELSVSPEPSSSRLHIDYFGNSIQHFEVLSPHDRLEVIATTELEVVVPLSHAEVPRLGWEHFSEQVRVDPSMVAVQEYCFDSPLVRAHSSLRDYASATFTPGRDLKEAVVEFNARIHAEFKYEPASTDISTPLATVLREKRGVCQDFAHVAVGCLRSLGLPARYVSGYLETVPPPGKERLVGADASHAWAATYLPGYGWLDFDPTNNVLPADRHVTVAWGRDFSDVSPLKGVVLAGGAHRVSVGVDVERRRTKPSPPAPSPPDIPQQTQSQKGAQSQGSDPMAS
ncbi:MAG TPA: transglutaminase family protein [Polyangiaceae bacterium]